MNSKIIKNEKMSCQHKYPKSKSVCKSLPLKDGYCTLHYKQQIKQKKTISTDENNDEINDKVIIGDTTSDNQIINLSDIQTTFKYNNLDILCIKINEYDLWFKAKEAAEGMGYKDTNQAIRDHVIDEDKITLEKLINLNPVEMTGFKNLQGNEKNSIFISEAGLYCLIMSSKKDEAKAFKKYVTQVILPSIRRTGNYISNLSNIASSSNELIVKSNEITYFYEINDVTPFLNLNVIYFGDTGEVVVIDGKTYKIYKIGLSHRSIERDFKEHKKTYMAFKMIYIKHCDNNIIVEQYLKIELKAKELLYELPKKLSNNKNKQLIDDENNKSPDDDNKISKNTETFILTERYDMNYVIDLINRLIDDNPLNSIKERDDKIRKLEYNNDFILQKMNIELKLKEEDTKQKEYDVELAKIQLEMMRLKYNGPDGEMS